MEKSLKILAVLFVMSLAFLITLMPELVNSNYAKPYVPLFAEVVAEIPEDVILPSYMDKLEQAYTDNELAEDGSVLKISVYREIGAPRLLPNGEEIYPYFEVIKCEPNGLHLILLSFIDDENHRQYYADEYATSNPATDILRKYIPRSILPQEKTR